MPEAVAPAPAKAGSDQEMESAPPAKEVCHTPRPVPESRFFVDASSKQQVASPRSSKRARTSATEAPKPQALSGASAEGVSILQTLSTASDTGITTESTEVRLDIPLDPSSSVGNASNGLIASNEQIEAQLAQARDLVESLKESHALADLAEESRIPSPSKKKRAIEDESAGQDDDDEAVPTSGTLADVDSSTTMLVDNRSFFGKLFRRKNKQHRRTPVQGGRETRALPSREVAVVALPEEEQQVAEGRRWVAGFGLAVAVSATAAAPYLFG